MIKKEKGTIIPLAAIVVLTLVAFMGLAFDASYLYFEKRRAQTAADAGAIGGAQELVRGTPVNVTTAARKDTSLNRFTHGTNSVDVTVNNPPTSGTHAGNAGYVEVIVTEPRPTWFMRVLGVQSSNVKARAVAGITDSSGCVYALNRDSSNSNNGIFVNGTTNSVFDCGVYSNSNLRTVGGGCIVAPSASYSGTYSNSNGTDPNCGPDSVGHGIPVVDPLIGRYTIPSTSPCTFNNYKQTGGALVLTPGVYCGGIDIGGSVTTATFSPGTYVLVGGGMKIGSSANATGAGVTFFNTYPGTQTNKYDGIRISTSGSVSFTAPTTGSNKALLFYQDPTVPWSSSNGSQITAASTSTLDGIIYFPSTDLDYAGNSSSGGYTMLVGYNIKIAGNAQIGADYSSIGGASPLQTAAFAE